MKLFFAEDDQKRKAHWEGRETTPRWDPPTHNRVLFLRRQQSSRPGAFRCSPFLNKTVHWLLLLTLVWLVAAAETPLAAAGSQVFRTAARASRISPILAEELELLGRQPAYDYAMPVIVRVEPSLFRESRLGRLRADQVQNRELPLLNAFATRLTREQIEVLLRSPGVTYITVDAVVRALGKKQKTKDPEPAPAPDDGSGDSGTGSDSPSSKASPHLRTMGVDLVQARGVTGKGVGVALFDSGIRSHPDLETLSRVSATVDFSPSSGWFSWPPMPAGDDGYGHGSHVAGIIGAEGKEAYLGVAPGVNFVNIKVLDSQGRGTTSRLISAIDWALNNRELYNIQVANFSLGHPPVESYQTDPLAQAVGQLVSAGVVVVASAGNLGQTPEKMKIWGGITSPGNSPAVITVGAINDMQTATHADDRATSYSSRGPSHVDGFFKPDISAPGNLIESLAAQDSYLSTQHPEYLSADGLTFTLSGSSTSAAYVSGVVALLLETNPKLTPNLVKAILMVSAAKLTQPHAFEQGSGLVNAETAYKLAYHLDMTARHLDAGVPPSWSLDGEEVSAGGAFPAGDALIFTQLASPGLDLWGNGLIWAERLQPVGDQWAQELFGPESIVWAESMIWAESLVWAETASNGSMVFADGLVWAESIVWAESMVWAESLVWAEDGFTQGDLENDL